VTIFPNDITVRHNSADLVTRSGTIRGNYHYFNDFIKVIRSTLKNYFSVTFLFAYYLQITCIAYCEKNNFIYIYI